MSTPDHPQTLVDLAALDAAQDASDLVYMPKGAAPRLLAALRALPRYDYTYGNMDQLLPPTPRPDGDWIKVSDLRALLGEKV